MYLTIILPRPFHTMTTSLVLLTHLCTINFCILAILLIGEPTHWESNLQLLIDLILTGGKPSSENVSKATSGVQQVPVIACNMDLVFMHQACMPRFGHGAFLVCLEALFKVGFHKSIYKYVGRAHRGFCSCLFL